MTRLVLPVDDSGIVLTLVQASGNAATGANSGEPGAIVDIDAACDQSFGPDWSAMWHKLDLLRNAKNLAFFSSVTDQALDKFR